MNSTAVMTPVEIDTELSKLWEQIFDARFAAHRISEDLKSVKGWGKDWNQLRYQGADRERLEARLAELRAKVENLLDQCHPFNDEYVRRGRWNRYYLVNNTNGHVHRGMDCSTCFPTTRYQWLIELADCDENAMISEWGEMACTICFPSAPTNPLYNRPSRRDREAQEAKAAEKAAKQAVKDAKGITDVDGTPLKDAHGYTLKTKVAARNEMSSALESVAWGYDNPEYAETVRRLVPALEAAGVDWRKAATNKIKQVAKEVAKPNPYANTLSAEQLAEQAARNARGLAAAKALMEEVGA